MNKAKTDKPAEVLFARIPADKQGAKLLADLKAVFNYEGWNLRVLYSGPRAGRFQGTTRKKDATAYRLYITRKPFAVEMRQKNWAHEELNRLHGVLAETKHAGVRDARIIADLKSQLELAQHAANMNAQIHADLVKRTSRLGEQRHGAQTALETTMGKNIDLAATVIDLTEQLAAIPRWVRWLCKYF